MKYYNNGGITDSGTTTVAEESALTSYAGPYVTNMLAGRRWPLKTLT